MGIILVRTYKHSGYPYLYTCAAMMFLASLFAMLTDIFYNWSVFCSSFYGDNAKCHGEPTADWNANIVLSSNTCFALNSVFWNIGHFLFAYRYFEVAEMFGRED